MEKWVKGALAGLAGGMIAGALTGLCEGLVIWALDPSAGAWAPLYGVVFYAALVAPGALGVGLLAGALGAWRKIDGWTARWAWFAGMLAVLLPVMLVVARFRIIRDIFHEKLAIASAAGIGVHLGLLIGAAALGLGLWWLLDPRQGARRLGRLPWPAVTGASLALMALLALPFGLLGGGPEEAVEPAAKGASGPPVILIMVDTLRADRLTSYGYAKNTSPNLSRVSEGAVQFDRAFAQASWTRPSVASLLTSLPPSAHKTMYKADRLPEDAETLAEAFKAGGFTTGGLVTNYNIAPYFNFAQGFDSYRYLDPDYYFWADEGSSKLSLHNLARVVREKVAPANDSPATYYQDAQVTTDATIAWIDKRKDAPFFLFVTYMDPHDPYFVRPLNGEAYSRAANVNPDPSMAGRLSEVYDGEIAYWDEHFGRLVAHLKAIGIYDKAIIAVTSDHGEEFHEHGGWWHGTTLYDEQIHIPLIIKMPAGSPAGFARDDLARSMDVAPTLLTAAGLKAPEGWRGRDLFGKVAAPEAVFAEEDHEGNVLRALRGLSWKIIEANAGNPRGLAPVELYELSEDPGELKNVAAERGGVLPTLQAALQKASEGAMEGTLQRDQLALDESSRERLKSLGYITEEDPEKKKDDEAPAPKE